jgi:hypothetical protein
MKSTTLTIGRVRVRVKHGSSLRAKDFASILGEQVLRELAKSPMAGCTGEISIDRLDLGKATPDSAASRAAGAIMDWARSAGSAPDGRQPRGDGRSVPAAGTRSGGK